MDGDNPYAVSGQPPGPIPPGTIARRFLHRDLVAFVLCLIFMLVEVVGALWLVRETESVMVTGALLTSLGSLLAVTSRGHRMLLPRLIGISGAAVSAGSFLMIFFADWGPPEARQPLLLIAGIYSPVVWVTWIVWLLNSVPNEYLSPSATSEQERPS